MKKNLVASFFGFFEQLEVHEIVVFFFAVFFMSNFAVVSFLGTHQFLAVVASGSMEPALSKGDLVVLSANSAIQENDVIVFEKNGETIIHRVVETNPTGFRTKGDKNPYTDSYTVRPRDIIGKMVLVLPKAGSLNLFLAGK
ncbi:MAG: signal peptidase I [Candidatus Diapherotrites archaeon]|nr:signal peptidase I [Candidatus Diapherotrites archaeon]